MIKLKKIYYPILAVVFAIALVLGFVASQTNLVGAKADQAFADHVKVHMEVMNTVHNSYEPENQTAVRDYITDTLVKGGILNGRGSKSEDYSDSLELNGPSYIVQEVTLGTETIEDLSDDELVIAIRTLYNIVVVIPGISSETVLFTANYDSAAGSQSGIESMEAAAMLQTVLDVADRYESGKLPSKTLAFVFTDAEHEGALGAYAFKNQFKGFNYVAGNIKLAVNFGAKGTGALAVSSDKLNVSSVKAATSGLNDAIDAAFDGVTDYDVYDVAKINVFFTGNRSYLNTGRDTIAKVSDSKIKALGGAMSSLVNAYGFNNVGESDSIGAFSYLGLTLSYSAVISYVLGGIALVLLIGSIFMLIRGGKFGGLLRGIVAQIASILLTAIILYACYFVLTLILAGFGIVPIHALTTIRYMNIGLFISSLLLAFAAYAGVFLLMRRFYQLKATDAARGSAVIISLIGIVLAFVMPAASFIFALTAILEGFMLFIAAARAKAFKEKNGADIERLFLYTLPLIVLTPAMIPVLVLASSALSAVYFPLILLVAVVGFMTIAPYFGLLKPALSKVAAKLPKHTVRVERVVTEQVEGAKKGRFQEVTHKKVVNEKVEWNYRNRYGVTILGVLSAILIIIFAVCPTNQLSTNIVNEYSYREAVKNDSVVYYWEQIGSGSVSEKLRVYDQIAYSYFGTVDNDFTWNPTLGVFEKDYLGNSTELHGTNVPLNISVSGNSLVFTTYDSAADSFIDITFTNMSGITSLTLVTGRDELEFTNDGNDTVRLVLPYDDNDYDNFTVRFNYTVAPNVGVEYHQYVMGSRTTQRMNTIVDYAQIVRSLSDKDFASDISCGMIFYRQNTYQLT
ncbi:MAG: M28 family peptidase [Clostridiales bacterium]|nr:M28 family peptidase [Clostridiales bacterium]